MADNTQVGTGSGDMIRDIDRGSAKTQVIQLDAGGQSAESLVSAANPLPIKIGADPTSVNGLPTNDISSAASQTSDAPQFVTITGDPSGDFAGVNILEKLVDDSGELKMAVRVVNPPGKFDAQGAQIASDAPAPINLVGVGGQFIYIDTTGYQSLQITSPVLLGGVGALGASLVTASNDGSNWATTLGFVLQSTSSGPVSSFSSGQTVIFPVNGRWVRLSVSSPGYAVAYLRNIPAANPGVIMPMNVVQIGGALVQPGGGAIGSLSVGGQLAGGSAVTTNANFPLIIGAADSGTPGVTPTFGLKGVPAIRSLLVDNTGKLRIGAESPVQNPQNAVALAVQDLSQFEGASVVELLSQILLEMRILNQQTYEMSALINGLQLAPNVAGVQAGNLYLDDTPEAYRAEPSIFNS